MAQRQIQIPERREDEPPASPEQLARIRELTTGQALQGYRFDYRKLGTDQADAVLKQLHAMNEQQPAPTKPRKQGPGCFASLAKGTTALIVWLVVLAGVAGGAYLIYWQMQQTPKTTESTDENPFEDQQANSNPDGSNNPGSNTRGSKIFEGLGVSDDNPTSPDTDLPDPPDNTPTIDPTPDPVTPPTPTVDRAVAQQLNNLEKMLVSLSQYTRNDFTADLRAASAEGMATKLQAFPQALSALKAIDPTIPPRIDAVIDAFASPTLDGPRLREEIKAIRAVIDTLQ
jgi:hypothetical protein